MKVWSAALAAASVVLGAAAHAADATPCTLADCVAAGLAHGPELAGKDAAIDAARAGQDSARGNYGPKLMVTGGLQVWDDKVEAQFDLPFPGVEIPPIVVREQVTWQINVTLAQPLSGLWKIYEANELRAALGVDVAELEREASERALALSVTEAWLGALLSDDLVKVAQSSLAARLSDQERAKALVRSGVIVAADALRADLGVTQAKQALALAQRQQALASARLTQLVGKPVVPIAGEAAGVTGTVELEAAKKLALEQRIELQQVRTRVVQARTAVDLAWSNMAPTVNLVAQAQFARAAAFGEEAAAFVGLTLDWTVFEWGATKYKIDEARANVRQAEAGLRQLEEGIELEVEAAWVEVASAIDQAALAREAAGVAAEHYELVRKRFDNKAATSFDMVEAETALTKARSDERLAVMNGYRARARLARAMGKSAEDIAREGTP